MIDLDRIPCLPQRQDSLNNQLDDLARVAVQLGMYDAHTWLTDLIRLRQKHQERERSRSS